MEALLDTGDGQTAVFLLKDDCYLRAKVLESIPKCQEATDRVIDAISVLYAISRAFSGTVTISYTQMYKRAMRGDLHDSEIVRDMFMSLSKMDSPSMFHLLKDLTALPLMIIPLDAKFSDLQTQLGSLLESTESHSITLSHDPGAPRKSCVLQSSPRRSSFSMQRPLYRQTNWLMRS